MIGGRRCRCYEMKEKELNLRILKHHTLGGAGEGRDQAEESGKKPSADTL